MHGYKERGSYVSEGRRGRTLPTPRPRVSRAPIPHLCLRVASRFESREALRRSEVEEDCSEDMMAVVRVWLLLLLTMMVIAATVPIGDLGNSDLR